MMKVTYYGRTAGITKKDAEDHARKMYKIPKSENIHLEFLFSEPPFNVYEVETDTTKRRK